jgi:MoCo/4Fe-4S cofactor protein with predicted Tat translocation signal
MENTTKRYWRGLEELTNEAEFVKNSHKEFGDMPSLNDKATGNITDDSGTHRRDFLKMLGFGVSAVALAACESPVKKAIPYLNKPEDVEPTIANYYASTYSEGGDYASILVKTREGRPIKIEANSLSLVTKGISARVQASVLSLYDNEKLKGAQINGKPAEWIDADKLIINDLTAIASKGGQIRIVSNTLLSPTTKKVIADFTIKYPNTSHITYDANSVSGLREANGGIVPAFDFSKAKTIVSIGADFLGTWISPTEFSAQWAKGRKVSKSNRNMSRHYQFESIMSNTGANADYRIAIKPSQEGLVVAALYNAVASKTGSALISAPKFSNENIEKAATDLVASKGESLVISGSNDVSVQNIINGINGLLNSFGTTINLGNAVNYRQGSDSNMNTFIDDAKAGKIAAIIFYNANPVYDHPRGNELAAILPKIATTICTNDRADETGSLCKYNTPDSHYLESWNDASPKSGVYSLCQPTISTIFKTRQVQSSLLKWAGLNSDYSNYLESNWKSNILKGAKSWTQALHDGVFETTSGSAFNVPVLNLSAAAAAISKSYTAESKGLELVIYEKVGMGTGNQANNPWLQELPEPVSKACWDNYASISQATAKELGLAKDDVVEISSNGKSISLPVMVQPGQANGTVAVAIGYGRTKSGKSANGVGVNIYPFLGKTNSWSGGIVELKKTAETRQIAQTQTHNTVMARQAVVQETTLAEYKKNASAGHWEAEVLTSEGKVKATDITLWNGHTRPNHSWGMVIDLNACTGCSACVVACSAENNVPVVGRQEVINSREMHWIRIDRYYSSDANVEDRKALEIASENPEVVFQPMMCQHCNNAPCETVCPVLATTHSTEGLNQMTYNRCIGTRYCANNCPYKVRRFNWFRYYQTDDFDFHFNNDLGRMVINPDVTVRSRGVMEKCSFCVQRIQAGKLEAKKEKRIIKDGEINVACAQTCPTNALIFGDKNDPKSEIFKVLAEEKEGRSYRVIEEINIDPNVNYLLKVRNKDKKVMVAEASNHAAETKH